MDWVWSERGRDGFTSWPLNSCRVDWTLNTLGKAAGRAAGDGTGGDEELHVWGKLDLR